MRGPVIATGVVTLLLGTVTTWAVTPWVARLGHHLGAVDTPDARKIHRTPVPRIGGLAVFAGFLASGAFAVFATGYCEKFPEGAGEWGVLGAGAATMLLLGRVDDIRGVPFQWKFAAQILAAAVAWSAGFRIGGITLGLVVPLVLFFAFKGTCGPARIVLRIQRTRACCCWMFRYWLVLLRYAFVMAPQYIPNS